MPKPDNQGLSREERLGSNAVSKLFLKSNSAKSRYFVVRAAANALDFNRIAPIASKKTGKANKRARIKRRIRAAYRQHKSTLPQGYDLALIARFGVLDVAYTELMRSLKDAIERACNLCNKDSGEDCNADN